IQLQAQLSSARAELGAIQGQRSEAVEALQRYQERLSRAPLVEQHYAALMAQLTQLTTVRDDLLQRERAAQLGQNMETELKGERFSLIEPPSFPISPASPNQILVLAVGLV